MVEYNSRAELMATQQSLLKEHEHQLNKETEENVVTLSHLSQCEQLGDQVPQQEIQQGLKGEKKNTSNLVALQELNEELPSLAKEQHWQLGAHALPSSTESESEAEEPERIGPKTERTLAEEANISWQHAALLREAVFHTMQGTVSVKRSSCPNSQCIIRGGGGWHS